MSKKSNKQTLALTMSWLQFVYPRIAFDDLDITYGYLDESFVKASKGKSLAELTTEKIYNLHETIDDANYVQGETAGRNIHQRVVFYNSLLKHQEVTFEIKCYVADLMCDYIFSNLRSKGKRELMMVMAHAALEGGVDLHMVIEPYIKSFIKEEAVSCNQAFISYFCDTNMRAKAHKMVPVSSDLNVMESSKLTLEDERKYQRDIALGDNSDGGMAEQLHRLEGIVRYSKNTLVKISALSRFFPLLSNKHMLDAQVALMYHTYIIALTDSNWQVKKYARESLERHVNSEDCSAEKLATCFFSFGSDLPERVWQFKS